MKRIALFIAAIMVLSVFVTPPAAQAGIGTIRVNNNTNRSVWITAYAACGPPCAFHIIGGGAGAFCLAAHQSRYMDYWKHSPMGEVKLRAEVKLRTDCAGPNIADTYDRRYSSGNSSDDLVGNVVEGGNDEHFYMKIVGN